MGDGLSVAQFDSIVLIQTGEEKKNYLIISKRMTFLMKMMNGESVL